LRAHRDPKGNLPDDISRTEIERESGHQKRDMKVMKDKIRIYVLEIRDMTADLNGEASQCFKELRRRLSEVADFFRATIFSSQIVWRIVVPHDPHFSQRLNRCQVFRETSAISLREK
jgi:hypothetical protein